ncbi:histidine phosphatase family protein [Kribbella solani]|uniref:phosphoglycerate mutase (2,3-diphosphoglycerate-dependent) n=1 Tax=Kribbella solani TaxID=236067 RepID=A0A841DY44_9ACTN|nr:histidine phosphatase family protein [Kribbella solani]MBB5980158.1 broad specificity phosphatase PhoE [Kribbella solani]
MVLLIVRHAESVENADKYNGFYQDPRPYDGFAAQLISRQVVGLTPRGFLQAQWLGAVLPTLGRARRNVYTSTYRRAIDTALIAFPDLCAPWPRRTSLLDEQHYGDATYMTKDELYVAYPELAAERRLRKHQWVAPGGESLADGVTHRAAEFIDLARSDLAGASSVVAFTHQTAVVAARSLLERRPLPEILAEEKQAKTPNAAILRYELRNYRFVKLPTITPMVDDG